MRNQELFPIRNRCGFKDRGSTDRTRNFPTIRVSKIGPKSKNGIEPCKFSSVLFSGYSVYSERINRNKIQFDPILKKIFRFGPNSPNNI